MDSQQIQIRKAISEGTKLKSATTEQLDQTLRMAFVLVGLRPQFYPNDLQAVVLGDFIRQEFGNHTTTEVVLAFRKAAAGELGDEAKLYDYFSPAYFGMVMKLYREWASEEGNAMADENYVAKLKQQDERKVLLPEPDWRQIIEADYQNFLRGVDTSNVFPAAYYPTLVQDEFIQEGFWKKKYNSVRQEVISGLHKELAALETTNIEEPDRFKRFHQVKELISQYREGKGEETLELISKQKIILAFFKYNRDLGNKNIYQVKNNNND